MYYNSTYLSKHYFTNFCFYPVKLPYFQFCRSNDTQTDTTLKTPIQGKYRTNSGIITLIYCTAVDISKTKPPHIGILPLWGGVLFGYATLLVL